MTKKTHKDRVSLIDRLERKYAKKVQLRNQIRRQNIKNALRTMRGRHFEIDEMRTESIDGFFRHTTA
jgi:hypothetical protein